MSKCASFTRVCSIILDSGFLFLHSLILADFKNHSVTKNIRLYYRECPHSFLEVNMCLIRVVKASLWNGPRRSGTGLDPVRWEEQAIYFILFIYAIFEKEDFFFGFHFICLVVLGLSWNTPDPHCGMWDLVPWPGIDLASPALQMQSLSHWTIREVPKDMLSTRLELKRILPFADRIFLPCEAWQLHQHAGEMSQEGTTGPGAIVSDTNPCSAWMQYSSQTVTPANSLLYLHYFELDVLCCSNSQESSLKTWRPPFCTPDANHIEFVLKGGINGSVSSNSHNQKSTPCPGLIPSLSRVPSMWTHLQMLSLPLFWAFRRCCQRYSPSGWWEWCWHFSGSAHVELDNNPTSVMDTVSLLWYSLPQILLH